MYLSGTVPQATKGVLELSTRSPISMTIPIAILLPAGCKWPSACYWMVVVTTIRGPGPPYSHLAKPPLFTLFRTSFSDPTLESNGTPKGPHNRSKYVKTDPQGPAKSHLPNIIKI